MSVEITLRGIPETVRDELAARADRAGVSLEEYLVTALIELASELSPEERRAGAIY